MPKIKYTTKELKRPDRFREFLAESLEDLSKYFNKILIGIGVIVVAMLAICFVSSQEEEINLMANEQFQKALKSYDDGEMETLFPCCKHCVKSMPKPTCRFWLSTRWG